MNKKNMNTNTNSLDEQAVAETKTKAEGGHKIKPTYKKGGGEQEGDEEVFPEVENRKLVREWIDMRRAKRAPITESVINSFKHDIEQLGWTIEKGLQEWCASGWIGFNLSARIRAQQEIEMVRLRGIKSQDRMVGLDKKDYSAGVDENGRLTLLK